MTNIMIRNQCNQWCLHCSNPIVLKNGILPATTDKEIINQLESCAGNTDQICFTGEGEPTMHKDLAHLIERAKRLGYKEIGIETNGMLLRYSGYIKKLKKSGLDYCVVTLHSHKEHIADKITQVSGSFRYTCMGLENLLGNKIEIKHILHTINKFNYKGLVPFIKFCSKKFGVRTFGFSFIRPIDTAMSISITPTLNEAENYIHRAFDYCRKNSINAVMSGNYGIPPCFMRGYEEFSLELSIYAQHGKAEHDKMCHAKEKVKGRKCHKCAIDYFCSGIPKSYAEIYGTGGLKPMIKSPLG